MSKECIYKLLISITQVLEGFVRSSKPIASVPSYPPPALPREYTPMAAGVRRSRFEPVAAQPRDQGMLYVIYFNNQYHSMHCQSCLFRDFSGFHSAYAWRDADCYTMVVNIMYTNLSLYPHVYYTILVCLY